MPREYDLLRQRSLFSRSGYRPPSTSFVSRPTRPASPALVGIGRQNEVLEALFEVSGREMLVVREGDVLPGGGRVAHISSDYVEFRGEGEAHPSSATPQSDGVGATQPTTARVPAQRVQIGRSLDGSSVIVEATTRPAGADVVIEGEDIISRMKRRRQQETGN
jgi:hypothetical protein